MQFMDSAGNEFGTGTAKALRLFGTAAYLRLPMTDKKIEPFPRKFNFCLKHGPGGAVRVGLQGVTPGRQDGETAEDTQPQGGKGIGRKGAVGIIERCKGARTEVLYNSGIFYFQKSKDVRPGTFTPGLRFGPFGNGVGEYLKTAFIGHFVPGTLG